jgi:hypothetical protein
MFYCILFQYVLLYKYYFHTRWDVNYTELNALVFQFSTQIADLRPLFASFIRFSVYFSHGTEFLVKASSGYIFVYLF